MKFGKYTPSQVRKAIVATIGVALILLNEVLTVFVAYIPEDASALVTSVIGFITAVSVFLTRNAPIIDAADGLG